MSDPRAQRLAEIMVDYSTALKPGQIAAIQAVGFPTWELVREVYRLALARQARYVEYHFAQPELDRLLLTYGSPEQLAYFPEHKLDFLKKADVYYSIVAQENSMTLAGAPAENIAAYLNAQAPLLEERVERTAWVTVRYPTPGMAQQAGMSLSEFEDFYFRCCNLDWEQEAAKQEPLFQMLAATREVRLTAADTDLKFTKAGLPAVKCCGKRNLPDGEVYTAPCRDSVEGFITYNLPAIYQGREFAEIRFEFKAGKIVKAWAGRETERLNRILDTDAGARYIGEFSLGLNPMLTKPIKDILFDEKISGSIHLTPGRAYQRCDNGNRSAIHWDLIKDLRGNGALYFDGRLIQKNGVFVVPELFPLNP